MLRTFVKVGNINNLSDARYCAGMGADLLGFPVNPKENDSISLELYKTLKEWVSGPEIVLETEELFDEIDSFEAQWLQSSHVSILKEWSSKGTDKKTILEISAAGLDDFNPRIFTPDLLILHAEGSDIASFNDLPAVLDQRLLLGLTHFDKPAIASVVSSSVFKGLSLMGSNEIRPGFKDYDALADVMEYLDED